MVQWCHIIMESEAMQLVMDVILHKTKQNAQAKRATSNSTSACPVLFVLVTSAPGSTTLKLRETWQERADANRTARCHHVVRASDSWKS